MGAFGEVQTHDRFITSRLRYPLIEIVAVKNLRFLDSRQLVKFKILT